MSSIHFVQSLNVKLLHTALQTILRDAASAKLADLIRERKALAARVGQLTDEVRVVEAERDKLAQDVRRLAVDLDDALDRETVQALDPGPAMVDRRMSISSGNPFRPRWNR